MNPISEFLAKDHDRLDALFKKARADAARIDLDAYEQFRRGLLKHVGMEELILMPVARRLNRAAATLAQRTRLDHAAITSLLIPAPTAAILSALHAAPEIPPAAHVDGPHVTASIRRALEAAGFAGLGGF